MSARAKRRLTLGLALATGLVLCLSIPGALRDAFERGGLYLFTEEFLDDIPRRLTGPGRMRFLFQPALAIALGILAGRHDSREGRPPFFSALIRGRLPRRELLRSAGADILNLVLMGVLVDAVCQRIILGVVHPAVALIIGPVLVSGPYAVARAVANRVTKEVDGRRRR